MAFVGGVSYDDELRLPARAGAANLVAGDVGTCAFHTRLRERPADLLAEHLLARRRFPGGRAALPPHSRFARAAA